LLKASFSPQAFGERSLKRSPKARGETKAPHLCRAHLGGDDMTWSSIRLGVVLLVVGALLCEFGGKQRTAVADSGIDREQLTRTVFQFRTRANFASDKDYGDYTKKTLQIGWRVRANVDYGLVKKGMTGTYYGTNGGQPPCSIVWDPDLRSGSVVLPNVPPNKATHVYWVEWHMVEIIGKK
jgi:hypothetical protein